MRRPDAHSRVVFLADYDMHLTEHLVQGVDVWLNTPRCPWEACRSRMADKGALGGQIVAWRRHLDQTWGSLHFGDVNVKTKDRDRG